MAEKTSAECQSVRAKVNGVIREARKDKSSPLSELEDIRSKAHDPQAKAYCTSKITACRAEEEKAALQTPRLRFSDHSNQVANTQPMRKVH